MAERDTRFGGNLETANIRPREYQPSDRGIANVSNVDDRSLFQRGADVGKNIYETVNPFIPEYRDDMMNWNVNTDYGRFGLGVGQGKGMLNWSLPFNISALDTGLGGLGEYQMAELTEAQKDIMRPGLNQPDLPGGLNKEQLWNKVKENEYGGWGGIFGIGSKPAQEPTTREEYDDYYKRLLQGEGGYWQT